MGQLGAFNLNFRTLLRRTIMTGEVSDGLTALNVVPTGSYGSLHTRGSLAQMVYSTQDEDDPEHSVSTSGSIEH